jgi:outer membrane cobalamin receptor
MAVRGITTASGRLRGQDRAMLKGWCRPFASAIVFCSIFSVPGDAMAQAVSPQPPQSEQPVSPSAPSEEVVPALKESILITATRGVADRDTSPASASVVTRPEIERRAVISVDQALAPVEGVSAYRVRGLADNESGIGMRGFSGRGSGQSRVLVLLDGQPINKATPAQ